MGLVLAEKGKGVGVGVGMAGDVFTDCGVGVVGETVKSFGVGAGMFADEPEEIEIFLGRLLGELFEHFRLGFGAENETDFFIPSGVDVIELAGAGVDEFFERVALLLHASDGEAGAFERVKHAEEMLAFAKDDLGGARNACVFFVLVLH